jgi:4-azaleucine resistance transporter AzlC
MRTRLSLSSDARDGLRDIAPVMIAAAPIGGLFGAIAASKGLSVAEVALMSTLVFAGGAQFAAIELWSYPVPVAAILFSTLLVNARHVLMGASLAPKTRGFSMAQRYLGFFFLTDEAWALAERRALARTVTPAYWFACAAVLPASWIGSSIAGAALGAFLGDRSASAPTSPSRRCSSGSSPASTRDASRRRPSPRAVARRRSLL